jgi:hypothetical protein
VLLERRGLLGEGDAGGEVVFGHGEIIHGGAMIRRPAGGKVLRIY